MLFNSVAFAVFLPVVFLLYWFVFQKSIKLRNFFLLIVSYVFYGWWDYRFLSLIFISSLVDYLVGINFEKTDLKAKRKILLIISLSVNLGFLGVFKYFNFFADNFTALFTSLGFNVHPRTINVILPVGISFYTFQTLSYTIDIYRKKFKPIKDFIAFFAFVSFFPQLVAGPIERASNLLPQFLENKKFDFDRARDGMRQILWGLFKKVVIADSCAVTVDYVFKNYTSLSGSALFFGVFFFAFQIYGDFSGYSDIAIGTAKLFGFSLMRNFNAPYLARDIGEFWRRWHISLSTWFRDYVFIPLGGNRCSKFKYIRNILITFTVSGIWHGANWTFVFWGFLNGVYYLPLIFTGKQKAHTNVIAENSILPGFKEFIQMSVTFLITLFAWLFFRAQSISQAFDYLSIMITKSIFEVPHVLNGVKNMMLVTVFMIVTWIHRKRDHELEISYMPVVLRWIIYFVLAAFVLYNFGGEKSFIYFQF